MFIPFLFAITVHEASHAYMAYLLGDNTAKNAGRLTLNPISHIDPMGLIVLLLTRMFGWAKPVPVDYSVISRKKYGPLMVAAAGPVSNFFLASLSAFFLYISSRFIPGSSINSLAEPIIIMMFFSTTINTVLGLFNLIPIPPLDGGRILHNLLPRELAYKFRALERWGMILVVLLLVLERYHPFLNPIFGYFIRLFINPSWSYSARYILMM
jgi:Zn-dependent protease